MKLNSKILAALIVVILFGGITFTTLMGWWATETSKVPAKYAEGEAAGEYNPADIRGSYTFGDVSTVFNIPIEDLAAAFNLPAAPDPAGVALKTLEDIYGDLPTEIGTASVRLFTAWYLGLPYQPEDTDYLPLSAADILRQKGSLTPEQLAFLDAHSVDLTAEATVSEVAPVAAETPAAVENAAPQPSADAAATEHTPEDRLVSGKTTFQQLLDWGVPQSAIESILGGSMPAPATIIKDHLAAQGLEFSSLKGAFQAEVDKAAP
jgi:hypothetical protein